MRSPSRSFIAIIACCAAVGLTVVTAPSASAVSARSPECTITGTDGDDVLIGTAGRDVICGGWGRDVIRGLGGDDILLGGAGDDRIFGGAGDDKLIGGSGDDVLRAGLGDDFLAGSQGDDLMLGGAGEDDVEPRDPLRDNPAWGVGVIVGYDLPAGTKVTWLYQLPSGNCINGWQGWTDTVSPTTTFNHRIFSTVHANPWESCAYEKSYGTWTVTAVTPNGQTKVGSVKVSTGSPNIYAHYAETICQFPAGFGCKGGSETVMAGIGKTPTPPVTVGPIA